MHCVSTHASCCQSKQWVATCAAHIAALKYVCTLSQMPEGYTSAKTLHLLECGFVLVFALNIKGFLFMTLLECKTSMCVSHASAVSNSLQPCMIIDSSFGDPKNLCRRMHDEVRVVADSPRLSALTAKTVGKALQLMAEKAEYMTFAGMLSKLCCSSLYCGVLTFVP